MAREGMVVVVTGGRDYEDRPKVFEVLDWVHAKRPIKVLITGACMDKSGNAKGADGHAEMWARSRGVMYIGIPAQWDKLGFEAGPKRNNEMMGYAWAMDVKLCIAFPGGRGTANAIENAKERDIRVHEVKAPPPPLKEKR